MSSSNGNTSEKAAHGATPERLARAERLVYEFQRRRLEETYGDFENIGDLRDFFFTLVYPPPDARGRFAARNKAITRVCRNWLFRLTFAPITIQTLEKVIELERLTESINEKIARALCERGPLPEALDDETYFDVSRKASTLEQRTRQLDNALEALHYGELFLKFFKFGIKQILRMVPKALIRNSDMLDLGVQAYTRLAAHKDDLESYRAAIRGRESARIGKMFEK